MLGADSGQKVYRIFGGFFQNIILSTVQSGDNINTLLKYIVKKLLLVIT